MNIKLRLAFQFTIIIAGVLLLFSALVYYFSFSSQRDKFRENLTNRAKNTAILLLNVTEVDSTLLTKIQQSTFYWQKEEIVVTDFAFHLLYKLNVEYLTSEIIKKNAIDKEINFYRIAEKDGVHYRHTFHGKKYNVFVIAYDNTRREKLADLRKILIWSSVFSIWVVVLLSYFFANNAIKPIADIIARVKKINHSHLSTRLDEGNKRDEIAQLSITFNKMLGELEIAFKNQADFVSNASHELRTPLSIMISESDYVLGKEQQPEIYKKHISGIVDDLKKLNSQLNTLLELAQINKEQPVQFASVRIDETIFSAIQIIKAKYPRRKIIPQIDYPENEQELLINGNYGMLVIAFSNLIDNACKFSKDAVNINVLIDVRFIQVSISDTGMGIPQDELDKIFRPFQRASNVKFIGGFGIGLSLVARILELHQSKSKIYSTINEGTRFELLFEKIGSISNLAQNI